MTYKRRGRIMLCALLFATGTAGSSIDAMSRQHTIERLAERSEWSRRLIPAGTFDLVSYASPQCRPGSILIVYIEGDGRAFLGPQRISSDPTPDDPIALQLAERHPGGTAVYLARPC
jgi:hypothetical protein